MSRQTSIASLLRVATFGAALVVPGAAALAADPVAPNPYSTSPALSDDASGPIPYAVPLAARPIFGQPRQTMAQPAALPGQMSLLAGPYDGADFAVAAKEVY